MTSSGPLPGKKRRRKPESATERLDQIESIGDRLAEWVSQNAVILGVVGGVILVAAAGYGIWESQSSERQSEASAALAGVQISYLQGMGSESGDILPAEPANPETARRVRGEHVVLYQAVSANHPGTPEAVVAVLEAGTLQRELGEDDLATETLRGGMSAAQGNDPLQGLLLIRLASASERDGDWVAAASLYEQAGRLPGYPAAAQALADAARSYAAANDAARAIALYDESVERAGKPSAPHIRSVIEELRATQGP